MTKSTGVRKARNTNFRVADLTNRLNDEYVQSSKRFINESSPDSGLSGESQSNIPVNGVGSFLESAGGVMLGQIAFNPKPTFINANGRIDLTPEIDNAVNSSYVLVAGTGVDDLRFIEGAVHNGQVLFLQGTATQLINLKHAFIDAIDFIVGVGNEVFVEHVSDHGLTTGDKVNILETNNFNIQDAEITVIDPKVFKYTLEGASTIQEPLGVVQTGNILTEDGETFPLDGTKGDNTVGWIPLIFDPTVIGFGAWRVQTGSSGGSGGGGVSFPIDFPEEQRGSVGGTTEIIDFTQSDRHAVIMELTGDIGLSLINTTVNTLQISSIKLKQDGIGGHTFTGFTQPVANEQVIIDAVNDNNTPTGFTEFVVEFSDGLFTAYLKTGNTVSGGGSGNLSDLLIDVNKDWLAQGISNLGAITGVTGITMSGATATIQGVNSIDMDGVAATIQGISNIDFFQASHSINSLSGVILYQVDSLDAHSFFVGGAEVARFEEAAAGVYTLDMLDNSIKDTEDITFDNASGVTVFGGAAPAIGYDSVTSQLKLNTPNLGEFQFTFNNIDVMRISDFSMSFQKNFQIILVPSLSGVAGINVGGIAGDVLAPANGDIHYNSTTDTFRFYQDGSYEELGGGAFDGANKTLSNLDFGVSVNRNLIPDQTFGGNLGASTAGNEWFNLFVRRVTFPVGTSIGAGDYSFGRVGTDVVYNAPSGSRHVFTIDGNQEVILTNVELILNSVNLDMENNNITDVNEIQFTGSSGDTLRGFIESSASEFFDIVSNENNSHVRIFARNNGGTLLEMIDVDAQSGFVNLLQGGISLGLLTNSPTITRIGNDLVFNVSDTASDLIFQSAASEVARFDGGLDLWAFERDVVMNANVTLGIDSLDSISMVGTVITDINFNTGSTINFDEVTPNAVNGIADNIPPKPLTYIKVKFGGVDGVIPVFAEM